MQQKLQIYPPGGTTSIDCKFDRQVAPLALQHQPCIALLAFGIELVSLSARVTSIKSQHHTHTQIHRCGPIDRTPGIPWSDKNAGIGANTRKHTNTKGVWETLVRRSLAVNSSKSGSGQP